MARLTKAVLADLRTRYGAVDAERFADGTIIALRRFTEEEAIRFSDRRSAAASDGERERGDYQDDGEQEILDAVVWPQTEDGKPDRNAAAKFLAAYPAVQYRLGELAREMGACKISPAEAPADLIEAHGKDRLVSGALPDGTLIVLRRLSSLEFRFMDRESIEGSARIPHGTLAKAAKDHLLLPDEAGAAVLWARYPFLSMTLGMLLRSAAGMRSEKFTGE